MSLSGEMKQPLPKYKVRYLCIENKKLRDKTYFRQEYIEELCMWGRKRQITVTTFSKKAKEGYTIEYKMVDTLPPNMLIQKEVLDTLIDMALATWDESWFKELIERRNKLFVI